MKQVLLIIFLGVLLFGSCLGLRGLCEPDEGRYAEIAREMIESGDYLQPRLDYIKHFHKPPLVYWLVSLSFLLFGQNEFAARIPVAIFALCGLLVTYALARNMGRDRKCSVICSLTMASSLQYFVWAQVLSSDMVFSFFVYAALFGFWQWSQGRSAGIYIFYLSLAPAFMVKGPVALLISFLIILIYLFMTKSWELIKCKETGYGIIIFLVLTSPWFIAVCLKNPGLAKYFIFNQSVSRLFSTTHGREGNMLYFIPVLLAGFVPWTVFWPQSLARYKPWRRRDKANLFLFLWIAAPVVFFSFSGSKLPGYILPVYPALAVLTGTYFSERFSSKIFVFIFSITAALYLCAAALLPRYEEKLGSNLSIRRAAGYLKEKSLPGDLIVNYRCFFQGLPFYLQKRVILVEKARETEFDAGAGSLRDYMFSDIGDFWKIAADKDNGIWIFCPEEDFTDLSADSPVIFNKVWQSGEYLLVKKRAKDDEI